MAKELDEFRINDDDLEEVNGGTNIRVLGRWMDCRKSALAICQNMNQYPEEGQKLVKDLYKTALSGDFTKTVELIKTVCSAFPRETKSVFAIGVDKLDHN